MAAYRFERGGEAGDGDDVELPQQSQRQIDHAEKVRLVFDDEYSADFQMRGSSSRRLLAARLAACSLNAASLRFERLEPRL